MNQLFQDYKRLVDDCKVVLVDDLDVPFKIIPTDFVIEDKKQKKYNRAKKKQEDRRMAEDYLDR